MLLLPAPDQSPYVDVAPDRRVSMARLATLFHLSQKLPWRVLVAPAAALARKVVPRDALAPRCDLVQEAEFVDRAGLLRGLAEGGYLRVPVVEDPGTFAARGAVIDVWPPSSRWPARIELEEDLCLGIKYFDPEGQRTVRAVKELFLHPAREALVGDAERSRARRRVRELTDAVDMPSVAASRLLEDVESGRAFFGAEGFLPAYYESLEAFTDYLPDDFLVVWDRPARGLTNLREEIDRASRDLAARVEKKQPAFDLAAHYLDEEALLATLAPRRLAVTHDVVVRSSDALRSGTADALEYAPPEAEPLDVGADPLTRLAADIRAARNEKGKADALIPLVEQSRWWFEHGYRVFVTGRTPTQTERVATLLRGHGVAVKAHLGAFDLRWLRGEDRPDAPYVEVVTGEVARGFALPSRLVAFVTEEEIFGARARRGSRRKSNDSTSRPFIDDLRALAVGDHVVHVDHGIGKYQGLVHRKLGEQEADLLVIEYLGGDKLYLPVTRLNLIQKFSGGEGTPASIAWAARPSRRPRPRSSARCGQLADELLRLQAERKAHPGRTFSEPDMMYQEFEATFPFEETADQAKAIDEVIADLRHATPMDRLVCGDVGFGKTEVAIRAAFHVATQGAQVAVLCPTTVLAQQHYRVFAERMAPYPIEVAVLSRFVSPAQQRETLKRLKEGKVDVVVGTHRLLSKDVHFKDLGLLVVDEEQRFGVTHKERIKQLKAQLDVLTLSATPIPRTLQMAVSGMRDLSLITTAPVDRRAVRTIVSREDPQILKEAVSRELARGGQVFFVYNRVEGLYERADKLQQLVPHARVAVAHGQMSPDALEAVMMDFVEGRYDVLCATAIIESGIDIPRANTIILDRADLFGLSQLYQLRGRVGRSRERAWCYLFVPPPSKLSDEARSRIDAIERFTALGSGFHVASLDLELRGAGDLLGAEQSGNVSAVGFDLYCQMLEEAVAELRGQPLPQGVEPELTFDEPSYIPEEYIEDVGVRLSLYKRLASASGEDEVADLAAEMEDRFGPAPVPARILVRVMAIKTRLRKMRALGIEAGRERVVIHLKEDSPVDGAKLAELCAAKRSPWKLTPDLKLSRRFEPGEGVANAERLLDELDPLVT
ncbi:MAG: transcription-repair coupling factor [Polyangiales bacterium]